MIFFLKRKLNESFLCFRFDIDFKHNLVLPLEFKVVSMKNLHSKNLQRKFKQCIVNIFQLINFCNCRIPNWQLYLFNILSLQRKKVTISLCSFYSAVYLARFSHLQELQLDKKVYVNTSTANYEYSRIIRRIYHYQLKCNYLKNQKLFVSFLPHFQNLHHIFNILKQKVSLIA